MGSFDYELSLGSFYFRFTELFEFVHLSFGKLGKLSYIISSSMFPNQPFSPFLLGFWRHKGK